MFQKGQAIHSKERNIINNVTKFCEDEARAGTFSIPISQAQKRAAAATGVSLRTIKRIKKEDISNGLLSSPGKHRKRPEYRNAILDNFDLCVLRNIVNEFYADKKIPSLSRLLPEVKKRINFPWERGTLWKYLHIAGFQYKRCKNQRHILMERSNIVSWRFRFLREIRKFREEKRKIIYLDETWLDSNLYFNKCWTDEKVGIIIKDSAGYRLIVVHAGSESGFIPNAGLIFRAGSASGDYHGQMNFENFEKWIIERLLPNIPPNSVIVMDNAAYHTKVLNPVPTKSSTKDKMCVWLEKKQIIHNKKMRKVELFELITANAPTEKQYCIDELLKEQGHDVLRLPPYHCDLNPIELIWADIKRYVRERNVAADMSLQRLQNLASEAIQDIGNERWKKHCTHIENIEKKYWKTDGIVEEVVENISFSIDSDSDTESDFSRDSFDDEI
nr:uncharacterized protein LOC122272631 [Parasteatoda tepidariorum]